MTLEQRLTRAAHGVADEVAVPEVDLAAVRARAGKNRRRRLSAGVVATAAAVAAVTAVTVTVTAGRDGSEVAPSDTPSSTVSTAATSPLPAIDTSAWTKYRSTQYDIKLSHPPGWTEFPASRDWDWELDAGDPLSPAHDAFNSPGDTVRVSVFFVPLEPGTHIDSTDDVEAWVQDYCEASPDNKPCTEIHEGAVDICLEKRDCHPGLLVPFKNDVQAFFSGGIYDSGAMTVVSVWRRESAPSVERYGGAQRLLEAFLSTMDVWPDPNRP